MNIPFFKHFIPLYSFFQFTHFRCLSLSFRSKETWNETLCALLWAAFFIYEFVKFRDVHLCSEILTLIWLTSITSLLIMMMTRTQHGRPVRRPKHSKPDWFPLAAAVRSLTAGGKFRPMRAQSEPRRPMGAARRRPRTNQRPSGRESRWWPAPNWRLSTRGGHVRL